jgi:membrane protein DedA with SNARE-associated domain
VNILDTSWIFQWALANGYSLMFLAMLVEGPVATAAGAFAAALGYFNIWIVFTLSVLGNLVPDVIYYALGFWGREGVINKYGRFLKITPERVRKLEDLYHKNVGKTLTAVKLVPILATPGLIVAGISKVPLRAYTIWSLVVTVPSSLFYLIVGYYFGAAYQNIIRYLDYGGYFIFASLAVFVLLSYLRKKYGKKLAEKIEKV